MSGIKKNITGSPSLDTPSIKQPMSLIQLNNISVQFGENIALENISFSVERGEYIGLIGPNGAGKSTLLKTILGLISPNRGTVTQEENITFGYVPQNYLLKTNFSISVKEVLEIGSPSPFFWRKKRFQKKIEDALEMVGLGKKFLKKNFQNLSGGQKQRVIIARSLLKNPDILFFDEPLSGVDFETKLQVYELLESLNKKYNTTIIFVSHEIESIISKCHRVLCLNKKMHEGCHPAEFAKGNLDSCTVLKTEKIIRPIHHHHSITPES